MAETKVQGLQIQLFEILDQYREELHEDIIRITEDIGKKTVSELKSKSPKAPGGGEYARSWKKRKIGKSKIVIYNEKHYQLTHLLEKGHISANQYGTYSKRVEAIPHIEPVEEKMIKEYMQELIREIKK